MPEPLEFSLPDDSNLDTAIDDHVEEISRLQRELCTLRNHRQNSRASVSRLPDEMLCEIFLYYVGDSFERCWSLNLACVCRRWRRAAIGFPRLWNHILIDDADEAVNAFVLRSGTCLLTVLWIETHNLERPCWGDSLYTCSTFAPDFFSLHAHRIHEMHIDLPFCCAHQDLCSLATRGISFPLVTHLDARLSEVSSPGIRLRRYDPKLLLPPHFLPRLKSLRCIDASPYLFHVLSTFPLADVVVESPDAQSWARIIVDTTQLTVAMDTAGTYYTVGFEPDDMGFLAAVATRGESSASTRQTMVSCRASPSEITLWDYAIPARDLARHEPTGRGSSWTLPLHIVDTCAGETHVNLLSSFPLPELSVLVLTGDNHYPNRAIFPWRRLSKLREISIEGFQGFMALLEGLERSLQGPQEGLQDPSLWRAPPAAFLPHLRVLELRNVPFRSHRLARKRHGKPSLADRLETALRIRERIGLLLEELYIIQPKYLDGLRYDPCVWMEGLATKLVYKRHESPQVDYSLDCCEECTWDEEDSS